MAVNATDENLMHLGLIVNPVAGLGGPLGFKGSDGLAEAASAQGAERRAGPRALAMLEALPPAVKARLRCWTAAGEMGERVAREGGLALAGVFPVPESSSAQDTVAAARWLQAQGVDLIVFVGGDGTARDLVDAVGASVPVLGVPAGVKMHSGVFAIHPAAAAEVIAQLLDGGLVQVDEADVRDLDEAALRAGTVRARWYGSLRVPVAGRFLQHVKCGGREVEELVQEEIAAGLIEELDPATLYLVGPGTTTQALFRQLGLSKTLLGVDVLRDGELLAQDADAATLARLVAEAGGPVRLIVTVTGGQGFLFGRGNQQFSPALIRAVGRDGLIVLATHEKLKALTGRPLLVDTGEVALDETLCGYIEVLTGYRHRVLYRVARDYREV